MVPLVVTIICIIYMICKEWNKLKFGMDEMKRLSDLPNKTHLLSTNSNPAHSHLPLQGTPHNDAPQLVNILLLSSVGRSGSSFLAELLFQQPSTIYFFEPELYFNFKTYKGVTSNASRILLDQLYQCKLDKDWVEWARTRNNVFREYDINEDCQNKDTTIFKQCIEDKCSRKYRKLIKVIKIRLSWVAEMLVNPENPLKVIYLVRDPRGSFTSLRKANMLQKDFKIWCPRILEDLELVNTFKALFPRDFFFVRYEDLCFDPWGTATKLWQFVSDSKLLPESWSTYLHKHTNSEQYKE
ncbi:carbohydrate sulfotransferase 4-like isoform X2 [Panulirus ornatus]